MEPAVLVEYLARRRVVVPVPLEGVATLDEHFMVVGDATEHSRIERLAARRAG